MNSSNLTPNPSPMRRGETETKTETETETLPGTFEPERRVPENVAPEWHPWDDYGLDDMEPLPIWGPPCQWCDYWRPRLRIGVDDQKGLYHNGVKLCHAFKMYRDFSCYLPRQDHATKQKSQSAQPVR